MKYATEEEKNDIKENILKIMGMPDTYSCALDKLWNHQIPESAKEWSDNLIAMKERLVELEEEKDKLDKEYQAQTMLGIGMFYTIEEENNENPSYQEV